MQQMLTILCSCIASGWIGDCRAIAATPIAGRIAFASVFIALIAWLFWVPTERLLGSEKPDDPAQQRSVNWVRFSAIAIAMIQALLYLFWA